MSFTAGQGALGHMGPPTVGGGYFTPPPHAQNIQPPYSNRTKKFANWNACYSCGFDIPEWHNSQTCPPTSRKPDHDVNFTRQNAQQYVDQGYACATRNRHRNVFPQMWRFGAIHGNVAFKCNETFSVISIESDPTQKYSPAHTVISDDDDTTVVTSNVSAGLTSSLASTGSHSSRMRTRTHHAPTHIRIQPRTHPTKPMARRFPTKSMTN